MWDASSRILLPIGPILAPHNHANTNWKAPALGARALECFFFIIPRFQIKSLSISCLEDSQSQRLPVGIKMAQRNGTPAIYKDHLLIWRLILLKQERSWRYKTVSKWSPWGNWLALETTSGGNYLGTFRWDGKLEILGAIWPSMSFTRARL